jgi:hypothetical protein
MTMNTKAKSEPVVVDDLRALRDALDAPARAKKEAEDRAREAEERAAQDGLLTYARKIITDLAPAVAASAAWTATAVNLQDLVHTFGADTPIMRAHNHVNTGSGPVEDAARAVDAVERLVTELARPALLAPGRLQEIRTVLDQAAGRAESFDGVYAAWVKVREDAVLLCPPLLKLIYDLRRRWTPSEAERAVLARWQARLDAAAAALPRPVAPAPRRGVLGAVFDAVAPRPSARRPLVENLEDIE